MIKLVGKRDLAYTVIRRKIVVYIVATYLVCSYFLSIST